jgi:hypothetical protein
MNNALVPLGEEMSSLNQLVEHAFHSKYFEKLGGKSAIFVIMARARELGMNPLEAVMGGLNIIQGRVEISPRSMNAMIRRAGHKVEILECTAQVCKLRGTRKDTGESLVVVFSTEDAKRAGIHKGAWLTYPDDMCFKSALSKLARRLFADIISTSYVEDEIERVPYSKMDEIPREQVHAAPILVAPRIESSAAIVVEETEPTIGNDKARILEQMIGSDQALLQKILDGYKISDLAQMKEKHFAGTKARVEELCAIQVE